MKNLEEKLKESLDQKLTDGSLEKILAEKVEESFLNACENLFTRYGGFTELIQNMLKSSMQKKIEGFDYSSYIVKLETVLKNLVETTTLDNRKLLENFNNVLVDAPEKVKVTEIFEKYLEYCSNNVDTDNLEVDYDDEPSYNLLDVSYEVEENETRSWSRYKSMKIFLECQQDEDLNIEINITKFDNYGWKIDPKNELNLNSLKDLSSFEIYLLNLENNRTEIDIDKMSEEAEVEVQEEPELDYR